MQQRSETSGYGLICRNHPYAQIRIAHTRKVGGSYNPVLRVTKPNRAVPACSGDFFDFLYGRLSQNLRVPTQRIKQIVAVFKPLSSVELRNVRIFGHKDFRSVRLDDIEKNVAAVIIFLQKKDPPIAAKREPLKPR